ncbi:MAG: hypothetical protein U0350_44225 [Caldilineaceae bacterium]
MPQLVSISDFHRHPELLAEAKRNKVRVEQGQAITITHEELKQLVVEKIVQGVQGELQDQQQRCETKTD